MSNLDHIRSYYAALNTGDVDLVASHFTDDAIHYYTRLGPHEGPADRREREVGRRDSRRPMVDRAWDRVRRRGRDRVDDDLARSRSRASRRLNRGTEWFRLRDGKIAEVRAYHHGDRKNPQGDLLGFDHAGRGYTTMGNWSPPSRS